MTKAKRVGRIVGGGSSSSFAHHQQNASSNTISTNPIFDKSLGQHILKNPLVAQTIVDKSEIRPTDVVLEVGPGTGNLTVKILEKAAKVITIEKDPRLAAELIKRVQGMPWQNKLHIIVGDVLQTELPKFDLCISNTPYQISSPLVFKLLACKHRFRSAILMFQREFALRLVAKQGNPFYCRLSVNSQMMAKVTHLLKVSRGSFRPPPQVDSSVVKIEPSGKRVSDASFEEWDGLVRVLFLRKNKHVAANFKSAGVLTALEQSHRMKTSLSQGEQTSNPFIRDYKEHLLDILKATGHAEKRASKMSLFEIAEVLKAFNDAGFYFASLSPTRNDGKEEEDAEMDISDSYD